MEKITFKKMEQYQKPEVKAPAHYFQDRALAFVEQFKIDRAYKASVFRWFKRRPEKAEAAFRNMERKTFKDAARYFFKLMWIK